jgi:hypothetical protein
VLERPPRSARLRWRLAVTLAAPFLGLLIAEAAVRAFDLRPPPRPTATGSVFQDSDDPILRFENRPGGVKTITYRGSDGSPARVVEQRVNAQGFRGPLIALERTPGTPRIACLGDSHTFGEGVAEEETWPAHLSRALAAPVEVMNCGVNAYDTLQELLWLERRVLAYQPDLVILQYYINDAAARDVELPEPVDALLELASPHRDDWIRGLRQRSWLAEFVLDGIYRRRGLGLYSELRTALYEPGNPGWQRAQDALRGARDLLAERGIPLGVALYPFLVERDGRLTSHAALEKVAAFCAAEGIPCLDTEGAFLAVEIDPLRVSAHDYHGNGAAHAIFAREVAAWMSARGWLQP